MMEHEGFVPRLQLRVGMAREMPGSDILKQGYLKKLKTMKKKYFVLRSTSSSGPARFDYHDNEKKFKANHPPKRSIPLHECFNINKKSDTKHKFAIALYLVNDSFSVIAEDEEEQNRWLNLMLEYQNEFLLEGEIQKVHYDYVWQGVIKQKSPQSCPGILGPYRLCLSDKSVCLVKVTEFKPSYDFMLSSIRCCGHRDNFFFMEVGRSAVTGPGELWMQVEETSIAQGMHDQVLSGMTSRQSDFRGRSNTGGSTISRRSTIHGDDPPFIRKRATSESHHGQGSPRRTRGHTLQRPQSTVVYQKTLVPVEPSPVLPGTSPHSHFDSSFFEERIRSDSMGSRSSRTSKHSDITDGGQYQNLEIITSPDHSSISVRSQTPETPVSITEEDPMDMENSDYLPMTPGQRSMTPSPTRGQGQKDRSAASSDYLPMTPTRGSGTPSPTRFLERPGSVSSEPQDISMSEGYMDMRPGSVVSSPASNSSGYIDMMPGQRTPTDPGPGYMIMDAGWQRGTAPIPIRNTKEVGYMDMGPSSQPLPTVKEGGSGEAYLPMSPAGQSPLSSEGLKPAKVFSYLSDDSMSGEFPKRAYSVGSRPTPKPTYRQHPIESIRRQPLDSSKSSSAPHLILQKSRLTNADPNNKDYMDMSSNASSLNQSLRSDDPDSFMEMDFYRPRTASDSYGCRRRSSSFGTKQVYQSHRPRSSSHGQSSKLSKLVTSNRVDSFELVRRGSQDFIRKRSQESLSKHSCSSNESLKKFSEDVQKKASVGSDYMDMGYDKNKDTSPVVHGIGSPIDPTGYVDMTLGSSVPKQQRGISPSSSSHSLGSSPASGYGHHEKSHDSTKIVHPSGKISQKQSFKSSHPSQHSTEQQLKVVTSRLKQSDKRSPASSGKESEDESYVPFQPGTTSDKPGSQLSGSHDFIYKSPPGIKIQHGYSRSYDSAVKPVDSVKKSKSSKHKKDDKKREVIQKQNKFGKHEKLDKESKGNKEKEKTALNLEKEKSISSKSGNGSLQDKVALGHSPTIERKIDFIPDTDLFSNSIFTKSTSSPDQSWSKAKADDSGYMEYLPGLEGDLSGSMQQNEDNSVAKPQDLREKELIKNQDKVSPTAARNLQAELKTGMKRNEAVLPQSKADTSVSDYILSDPVSVSDYILSDPASNVAVAVEGAMSSVINRSNMQDETFSYIDFDPASKKPGGDKSSVKSPVQVKSFFASEDMSGKKESKLRQEKCSESKTCSSSTVQCEENSGDGCMGDTIRKGSNMKPSSNSHKQEGENESNRQGFFKSSKLESGDSVKSDNKTVIEQTVNDSVKDKQRKASKSSAEEIKAKFVVLKNSEQEVMDEGYIELDFTNHAGREEKKHHRSGSSSSTASIASDKSRKGTDTSIEEVIPSPSPIVSYICTREDDLPRPQVPLSYICDNTHSDPKSHGGLKDPSSPDKHGSGKTSTESDSCCSKSQNSSNVFADNSQTGEVFTSAPVQPLNLSQVNQALSQLSRQTSVPLGPSYSPRTSEDIQSIRTRKVSGPATLSVTRKTSNSGNIVKQLEPVPAGQEAAKQVNLLGMNSPLGVVDKIRVEKGQEMGQRHSYTDLSQYGETSTAGNLEKLNSGGRSNSQQQLTEVTQENKLNYADLDLKGSSENVDEKPRVNYATINFEKTESLKNSNAKEEVKFSI